VIEGRSGPGRGRMADRTIGGKPCCSMAGIVRALIIGSMASDTCCAGQAEIIIHMAGAAGHGYVRSCKRKSRGVVIKVGLKPCIHPVARLAICRKATRNVIRRNRVLEIPDMAGIAVRR
jgi:hypothetical protein